MVTLTEFRTKVRNAALAAEDKKIKGEMLQLCDEVRDDPRVTDLGFGIVDLADGTAMLVRSDSVRSEAAPTAPTAPTAPPKKQFPTDVPPQDLFKLGEEFQGKFGDFDDQGFPTKDANGENLSKSLTKKLKKRLEIHTAKYNARAD